MVHPVQIWQFLDFSLVDAPDSMSVNTSYANITDSVWTVRHFCSTWSEHGAEYMHGRLILQPAGENNHNLERKGPRPYVELHGCCWLLLEPPSSLVPSLPHLSSRVFITAAEAQKQPRSSMYGPLSSAESSWQFGTLLVGCYTLLRRQMMAQLLLNQAE